MMKSFMILLLYVIRIESAISTQEISYKSDIQPIYVHELFTFRVSSDLFNWTSASSNSIEQFRYRPSLLNRPSLPLWMNFQFSKERQFGYLYGSATEKYANRKIDIEIVGLNKQNYETRRIVIPIEIIAKAPPINRVEMNITNLNWVHLTDLGRVRNLKGIFTDELWQESADDLSIIFMESAIKFGARLPLKPQNREGVIVHLGSNANFSKRLMELNEEIKPLSKLTTCTFKKTKVQQIFQNAGFSIDWCAFKIISADDVSNTMTTTNVPMNEDETSTPKNLWVGMARDEVPDRNYSEEIAIAVAVPSVLFAILVALLTVVLCFHHEKFEQQEINEPLQMVQYSGSDNSPKTTTLRSLREPYTDNLSLDSQSPTNSSFIPEGSPKLNPYYRPNPPAYTKGRFDGPTTSTVRFVDDI